MRRIHVFALAAALFAAGAAAVTILALETNRQDSGAPLIGGPFTLTGAGGNAVSDRDFRGKLMLVFFGYTNCPDVCPTELQVVAQALDKLGSDADRVAPLFITLDPGRDTPSVIGAYTKNFDARIVGLTGTEVEISAAAKAYRVYRRKADAASNGANYTVDHSAFTYLMDGKGNYITHFTIESPPEAIAQAIERNLAATKGA